MSDEQVYIVPRAAVPDQAAWHGLRTDGLDAFVAALERDGRYEPRDRMERDPSCKQVIPYLVLRDGPRFFLMQRTTGGRRCAAPRPLLDRGRRAPEPGRRRDPRWARARVARGARRGLPARVPAHRAAQRRHDRGRRGPSRRRLRRGCGGPACRDPRDRQADRRLRRRSGGRRGRRPSRDVEPARLRPSRRGRTIGGASRPKAGPIIATPGQRHADTAIPADMSDPASSVEV